jgi:hypothetical protein
LLQCQTHLGGASRRPSGVLFLLSATQQLISVPGTAADTLPEAKNLPITMAAENCMAVLYLLYLHSLFEKKFYMGVSFIMLREEYKLRMRFQVLTAASMKMTVF